MKISANITKTDLLKMNIESLMSRATIGWLLVLYAFITYPLLFGETRLNNETWIVLLSGLMTTLVMFTAFWFFIVIVSIISYGKSKGILGKHIFTISPEGFIEETDVNTTTTNWSGIQSIKKTRSAIYVRMAWHLIHVIPKSSFASSDDFDAFYNQLVGYRKNA